MDILVVGNDASHRCAHAPGDLLDAGDVSGAQQFEIHLVDEEAALLQPAALQLAVHRIRVAQRHVVRRNDHDAQIRRLRHVFQRASDAEGHIDEDIVEIFLQDGEQPCHMLGRDAVDLLELGTGQHVEPAEPVVVDQRLFHLAYACQHVAQVEQAGILHAQIDIQVAQSHVKIHKNDPRAFLRQGCS